jgi:O-antigen ligase
MTYFYAVPLFIVILLSGSAINPIVILIAALVGCGISLGYEEIYLNHTRGGQFYGRPIIWGGLCLFSAAILSILASYELSRRKKWIAYTLATIGILACLLSHSRGPTTLFVVMLAVTSFWIIIRRASIQTYILIAIAALVSYFVVINDQEFQKRIDRTIGNTTAYFTEGGNKNSSIGIRFELWKSAIAAFQEKPIFGNSIPEFMKLKENMIKEGLIHKNSASFTHVHNDTLQWLGTRGLFGLLIFVVFFTWLVGVYWKGLSNSVTKPYSLAGLTLVSGILYCGLTDSFLHTKLSIFYFVTINFLLIRKMELLNTHVTDSSTIA